MDELFLSIHAIYKSEYFLGLFLHYERTVFRVRHRRKWRYGTENGFWEYRADTGHPPPYGRLLLELLIGELYE